MVGENIYEPLEDTGNQLYSKIAESMPERQLNFVRGKLEITPFARLLITACFSNEQA